MSLAESESDLMAMPDHSQSFRFLSTALNETAGTRFLSSSAFPKKKKKLEVDQHADLSRLDRCMTANVIANVSLSAQESADGQLPSI